MDQITATRSNRPGLLKILSWILLLLIAAVFLFSGLSKLFPHAAFEHFTWSLMDAGIKDLSVAALFARLIIGFELLLGVFLLTRQYLRRFSFPAAIGLLLAFTAYLLFQIIRYGNTGDCGCFGEWLPMSPMQGILKNLLAIGILALLIKKFPDTRLNLPEWVVTLAGLACFVVPFIMVPPGESRTPETVKQPIDLSPLYETSESRGNIPPEIDLRQGKHIVAFLSLSCGHCRKAAFEFQVIYRQHPEYPLYMVLNGNPDHRQRFFEETRSAQVPHSFFTGAHEFLSMAGPAVPAIYWINNGVIERKSNYYQLDPRTIEQWLMQR